MLTSTRSVFVDRLQSISRGASVATVALGCAVLVGWLFEIPTLKSLLPGLNAMKVNTAICFVLCGLALWLLQPRPTPNILAKYIVPACAVLALSIGLAALAQYVFGWDLHIDQLMFVDTTPTSIRAFPGRMVPATAVMFVLFGVALLSVRQSRLRKLTEWATFVASFIAAVAFIGLLYDAGNPSNLYLVTLYRGIALHTVAGSIVFSLGLLCLRPDQGLMSIFVRDTPGGDMARRLLPMVIGLPVLIGALRQTGERMGLYPAEFGAALNTIIPIGVLVILIWQNAHALDRSDLERRRSEQALQESEDKFRYVFDHSLVAKSITHPSGALEVNQAFCDMLGYSQKELQGGGWQQITHPDDMKASHRAMTSILSGENASAHFNKRYVHKNGATVWTEVSSTLRRDSEGQPLYFLTSVIDVTERKQAEEQLKRSEERFRTTFDNMLEGAQFLGFDWRYLYINKSAEVHNRRPNQELLGNVYMDMWPGIESTHVFAMIKRCMVERIPCRMENEFTYPNGAIGWFELIIQPAPEGVFIFSSDITERKRAELDNAQLAAIVESSIDAIISKTLDGIITSWNVGAEQIYGYPADEAIGQSISMLVPPNRPDEIPEILQRLKRGESIKHFETVRLRKDGMRVHVSLTISPVKDILGQIYAASTIARDITEHKQIEQALQTYTAKLEQSNRDLQEFAYVASHDLQEPLRKVQAFSDRLATKYADAFDETGRDYLNRMRDASQRMQTLINDLLSLSRVSTRAQSFAVVDLNPLAQEVLSNLEHQVERAEARVEVGELPTIEADATQMRQLLQNLIGNALKFHLPERPPVIKVSAKVEGVTCQISVADNGIGFDTHYLDRIFKPFQRLHSREEYEGSGMGLAICRRIVERHGGAITATSVPGAGATFLISLPTRQLKEKDNAKA